MFALLFKGKYNGFPVMEDFPKNYCCFIYKVVSWWRSALLRWIATASSTLKLKCSIFFHAFCGMGKACFAHCT